MCRIIGCTLLFLTLLLSACGKEETAGPDTLTPADSGSKAEAITTAELEQVTKAAKQYRITLIVKTRNNPFFDPMIRGFETEAKMLGFIADVQSPAQEGDSEKQFSLVENVTAQKVDAIVIAPADSKGIVPALKKAQDKGILVINLDNRVDKSSAESAGLQLGGYVGADNEAGGKLGGEALIKSIGGSGKVALLEGIRGVDNAEARKRGFETAVQGKLDIVSRETGEWETNKAYGKFVSVLAANPDLAGVFCANDNMAIGAVKAISEANKKGKVKVVGFDNIPDVRTHLDSGDMAATIEQHPDLMGKYGARLAVGILDGSAPRGRELLVPLEVIKGK